MPADPEEPQSTPENTLAPGLYLVATPIGNLGDITLRALDVLRRVDRIACEDTRQTQKLLNHFEITTPTVSCHQHNEHQRAAELIAALKTGGRIAVVSDAGMPGISDPGSWLTAEAIAAGVAVIPIPGANAALSALVASGLSTEGRSTSNQARSSGRRGTKKRGRADPGFL
jgi:16S rRNA (cytidine1402-2'-O)-methyltransferase